MKARRAYNKITSKAIMYSLLIERIGISFAANLLEISCLKFLGADSHVRVCLLVLAVSH